MTIAELAARAGVPVSTIRFYERRGAMPRPARAANGYRTYGVDDVRRVRFLRRGRLLGFTLAELTEFAALSAASVASREVQATGAAKLAEIDERIADLHRVRAALVDVLADPCPDPDAPCPVVAALADDVVTAAS